MARFFAALLAIMQAATPPAAPPDLDARWVVTFESTPVATPGYDANTAYMPLKEQLVAVNLDRGTIRWSLDVPTSFTPATGGGMVFTVNDSSIEAREAGSGAPVPCGTAGLADCGMSEDRNRKMSATPATDPAITTGRQPNPCATQNPVTIGPSTAKL